MNSLKKLVEFRNRSSVMGRVRLLSLLVVVGLYGIPRSAEGAVITANSVSLADVRAAIATAINGDTVAIPAGTAYWNDTLTVSGKAITVRGAGTSDTIIVDEIPDRSKSVVLIIFGNPTGMFRLTGLQFRGGTTNTGQDRFDGVVQIYSSNLESNNSVWRIDNCFFKNNHNRTMGIHAWSGLIDHCIFWQGGQSGISFDTRVNGTERGDRAWANPVRWGTIDAGVYVEDCYFTNTFVKAVTDAYTGARYVFRKNIVYNGAAENHGTETTMRARGGRAMEVYGNKFICNSDMSEFAVLVRSGPALIYSNSVTGNFPGLLRMQNYRDSSYYRPWGQATGKNVWDDNLTNLFASGTHTGSTGVQVLTDGTKSWSPGQWDGHHLINNKTGQAGIIAANTATMITCAPAIEWWSQIQWSAGDAYEIRKINKAMDQPGAGQGDMIYGTSDETPPTPTRWPHQKDEPIHYWSNTGITSVSPSGFYTIKAGRDYTNAPFANYSALTYPHPYAINPPENLRVPANQ